jgi:glucose/mannose transport system substrate-binding protein
LKTTSLAVALAASVALPAMATDLEVTHWWTSGGEAAAVAELAKAFDASGDHWIDGAIAGSGGTARPIMISRITGGDPMGATQFNHGQQAQELVEAGLMQDLTAVAEAGNWRETINPIALLDACTIDGRIYCAPVNIHSPEWLWLNNSVYENLGIPVPQNWDEFVASADQVRAAGIVPLALGNQPWQSSLAFGAIQIAVAGIDAWRAVNVDKDMEVAAGPIFAEVFQAAADARELAVGSNVQDWNQATNMVITGTAAAQIMGDWAQGEFAVAEKVAGVDYTCLPGLGLNAYLSTGGDAFYFPVNSDPEITAAQERLAAILVAPETQVAFNLKKGSLPIRGDVDLSAANDCMRKGLAVLEAGNLVPGGDMVWTPDTQTQTGDLMVEFWMSDMTPEDAQARWVEILSND